MNKSEIVNDIFSDQVIFLDGAMGTMLQKSGFAVISTHGDLDGSAPARDTERLYFTAKRL